MKNLQIWLLSQCLLIILVGGCSTVELVQQRLSQPTLTAKTAMPTHPVYVVTSAVEQAELLIVDPATWQIVRRSPLLRAGTWDFNQDPQGRIWLGYGAAPGVDERVQVFAPDGALLKTLTPCVDPYNKIHFAAGRAFIPCIENGFQAAVVIVDLQSLEIQQKLDIRLDNDSFLLASSSGNEDYLVMVGNGDTTNRIILMDTQTLTTLEPLPIPPSAPFRILPYYDQFILLNSFPESTPTDRQDLLILSTKNLTVAHQQLPMVGALWGAIDGDLLYTYHNIEENGLREEPSRAISRFDLRTGQSEMWMLPERWNARDLAIVNGEIVLVHSVGSQPETSGLYRFEPTTGELTLFVNIPYAQRILPPSP